MPRVRTIPPDQAGGELAEAYAAVKEAGFPAVPSIFALLSVRPDLVRNLAEGYRAMFASGRLDRSTKEGIATWVSALNQCPY
jgi:alkylhydroperoxidase family enzyme